MNETLLEMVGDLVVRPKKCCKLSTFLVILCTVGETIGVTFMGGLIDFEAGRIGVLI